MNHAREPGAQPVRRARHVAGQGEPVAAAQAGGSDTGRRPGRRHRQPARFQIRTVTAAGLTLSLALSSLLAGALLLKGWPPRFGVTAGDQVARADLRQRPPTRPAVTTSAATTAPLATAAQVAGLLRSPGGTRTAQPQPPSTPTGKPSTGLPVVGAVFPEGTGSEHTCSGGVISAGGVSVVLTAAHCLSGSSEGVRFVPGYHDGLAPYGVWNVVAAFADPRWLRDQDPHRDYVFLQVAPVRDDQESGQNVAGKALQDVVAGDRVAVAPEGGTPVQVIGYPTGINDRPVTCTVPTYRAADYPAFDCHGYVGGTSGAPWLALAQDAPGQLVVRGLIGGRSRGGCVESTSYSPPFDADTLALLTRATSGGAGDSLPDPGSGGC